MAAAGAVVAFMIGLIAAPVIEWSARLPELGSLMKDKLHVFDRPLWLWQRMQSMLGGSEPCRAPFQLPKIEWVQPTVGIPVADLRRIPAVPATLILFIASWRDLRRALVMTFGDRESRLRTLRILNAIEEHLGSYLLMVTMINLGVGVATGIICAVTGMPNPAGARRAGRDTEFHSDHRPGGHVRDSDRGRRDRVPDAGRRAARAGAVRRR